MRRYASGNHHPSDGDQKDPQSVGLQTLAALLPYLWRFRWRVTAALSLMILAKVANVGVPLVMKGIVDHFTLTDATTVALTVPFLLLLAYGFFRVSVTLCTELRELVFARVTYRISRLIVVQTFRNMLALSFAFHLSRRTGAISRDIERGINGVSSLMSFSLYSILPTVVEVGLVIGILILNYSADFALIALTALTLYIVFTVLLTYWRIHFRREMNEHDSQANNHAVDALLNYETVKLFGKEFREVGRYDALLQSYEAAAIRSQSSLSLLNMGQALIIAIAVSLMMWRATVGVAEDRLSIGDLVLVNAFMIQLYQPLNFLGTLYRQMRQNLTDIERMFLLMREKPGVADQVDALNLQVRAGNVCFDRVTFAYNKDPVLHDISFEIAAGTTLAVVGSSGSGKSTLARLLFRLYDPQAGRVEIDGQDLSKVKQSSLREQLGIVAQDTVLFNETIEYNVAYSRDKANHDEVKAACIKAQIHNFISTSIHGYQTLVGERGLKLSGGEKQRIAIARALLKDPQILVFDEATSALDSDNERAIQSRLNDLANNKTVLIIAHRLSTIAHADQIIVLEQGRIVERGKHQELIAMNGRYAEMWRMQLREKHEPNPTGK